MLEGDEHLPDVEPFGYEPSGPQDVGSSEEPSLWGILTKTKVGGND